MYSFKIGYTSPLQFDEMFCKLLQRYLMSTQHGSSVEFTPFRTSHWVHSHQPAVVIFQTFWDLQRVNQSPYIVHVPSCRYMTNTYILYGFSIKIIHKVLEQSCWHSWFWKLEPFPILTRCWKGFHQELNNVRLSTLPLNIALSSTR